MHMLGWISLHHAGRNVRVGCGRPMCSSGHVCSEVSGRQLAAPDSVVGMTAMCACCAELVGQTAPVGEAQQRLDAWHDCTCCACEGVHRCTRSCKRWTAGHSEGNNGERLCGTGAACFALESLGTCKSLLQRYNEYREACQAGGWQLNCGVGHARHVAACSM